MRAGCLWVTHHRRGYASCRCWPAWVVWGAPGATAGTDFLESHVLRTGTRHIFDAVCAHFWCRLPLENWSAIVLWKTWRCVENAHVQIYISICVCLCLHWYYYVWNDIYLHTFQLLAGLLTMYTYGHTQNSICVQLSTYLYTYISNMYMPTYTHLHIYTSYFIFTHHVPQLH